MQDLSNGIKNFGEVKIEKKTFDVVLTRRKDKQAQIIRPHISSRSLDTINLKMLQTINTTGKYVRGCCLLPDSQMTFSHNSNKAVRVFSLNGTRYFDVKTQTNAFDISYISNDNTLAVSSGESDTKCITIIDLQSKQIKKTIPVDSKYYGIGVTDGKFICSAEGKGIHLIDPHNSSTVAIVRDDKIPAYCYVALFCDTIYHTNTKRNTVTCYDLKGTVQWVFKNESVLRKPSGISVDKDGIVYVVGEFSKNVVVLSADGKQYKEIATENDGLHAPLSLDYNRSTNQLLVSNFDKTAPIYTLI